MSTEKNEIKCADCGHNKGSCDCLLLLSYLKDRMSIMYRASFSV